MKLTITLWDDEGNEQTHELPARWEICDRCHGNGTHDHPAFSSGLTQEDFAEDDDFRADYMAGRYDVTCEECEGAGKVRVIDEERLTAAQRIICERWHEQQAEAARDRAADAYTRRMEGGGL